jgi:TonB-dependent SusC/RagA subfamily outer membrane receptor
VAFAVVVATTAACSHSGSSGSERQAKPQQAPPAGTVTAETINQSAGMPIERILADHVSGVILGHAPDGSLTVQIRGAGGGNGGEPLYVIDGIPVMPGPGGSLAGINPYDIASIRVLKDASSTTMYGSRGANGVIEIKMKK